MRQKSSRHYPKPSRLWPTAYRQKKPKVLTVSRKPAITLEKVRGILADKSRAGHTAEVRAIIQKHGADRLSEVDPDQYAAIIQEAEVL